MWAWPYELGLEELEADREELLDLLDGVFEGEEDDLVIVFLLRCLRAE